MKRHIEFTRQPIIAPPTILDSKEIGAQVEFQGLVRELENGKKYSRAFLRGPRAHGKAGTGKNSDRTFHRAPV